MECEPVGPHPGISPADASFVALAGCIDRRSVEPKRPDGVANIANNVASRQGCRTGVSLDPDDQQTLEAWVRGRKTSQRLALRSRIVLMLADGASDREAARVLGIARHTVALWRVRFLEGDAWLSPKTSRDTGAKRRVP